MSGPPPRTPFKCVLHPSTWCHAAPNPFLQNATWTRLTLRNFVGYDLFALTWEQRRRYSFQIFKLRAAAQTSWRRSLVQAAASGDWASRRLLQKRQPLLVAARPLLDKFHGDQRLSKSTSKTNFLNLKAKNPWTSSWTYLIVKHPFCRQRLVGQLRASSRTKPQECLVSAWAS